MNYLRNRACRDCPAKRTAMPGYTGPYENATEMVKTMKEGPYACHMGPGAGDPEHAQAIACYGAAVLANKSCHRSRNPDVAAYQTQVGTKDPEIMNEWEAIDYHNSMGGLRDKE